MEALVLKERYKATVENVAIPEIRENEVLIKVKAVGVCGTDFKLYSGDYGDGYPLIPGHEFSGVVEKIGSDVQGVNLGQRVTAVPPVHCGYCIYCLESKKNQCLNRTALGILNDGAFAQYVKAPASNIIPIGDLSFVRATFIEPLACVLRATQRAQVSLGEKVLILGTGTTGYLFAQVLKGMGCDVHLLGRNPAKLKIAHELGVKVIDTKVVQEQEVIEKNSESFDALFDAIGNPQMVQRFVSTLKRGGRIIAFGVSQGRLDLDYFDIYRRELSIIGSFAQKDNFPQAITLLKTGAIDVEKLITGSGGLTEVKSLFQGTKPTDLIKFVALIGEEEDQNEG